MANGVFNIAKGRVNELVNRVIQNDPTNAVLVLVLLKANDADATLIDYDDLATLLAAPGNTESTDGSYARKIIDNTDADIAITVDDVNDRHEADFSDQTWTGLTGETFTKLLVCYDSDSTGGTDSNIIPCTHHDFAVTSDGSDITAQLDANGFFRAA